MEAMERPAAAALSALEEALIDVRVGCRLIAGDLIIIDNRVAAHARTAFRSFHDGSDRWLQRLFVVEDFACTAPRRRERSHVCRALANK
jgi:L-asparagine oxygenase